MIQDAAVGVCWAAACMMTSFAVVPGYWNVTVYGRKHCYRLYTKLLNEATRWSSAIQNVIDTKAPIDTPTQQLIQDIKVGASRMAWGEKEWLLKSLFWLCHIG